MIVEHDAARRASTTTPLGFEDAVRAALAMKLLNRQGERRIANAVIADPEEHTVMDASGAVRSIQAANVDMPEDELLALWQPVNLERLARTYWKYLSRASRSGSSASPTPRRSARSS